MPCDYAVHVRLDDRLFIVEYDADGFVLRIKERKTKQPPMIGAYDTAFWHPKHHAARPGTRPARIIAAALAKMAAEDRAVNATL